MKTVKFVDYSCRIVLKINNMEPEKKISFGFSKITKKPQLLIAKPSDEKKVELIDSLEGNTIKIKNAVEIIKEPLVIPIKDNKKNILDRIRDIKNKQQSKVKDDVEDDRPDSELTIDELAARELIREAKRRLEQTSETGKVFVLPMKEDKIAEGELEPTMEDYENIPISDYGMAMLRGMGWKEGMAIGNNQTKSGELAKAPEMRPKGLGLGANKLVKTQSSTDIVRDKDGKELILKTGAFAKIIAGSHKGNYCEVQGLDDESGRVIVKTSLKREILTLNEFLVIPVTKEDYSRNSNILNSLKFEEYKEREKTNQEGQQSNLSKPSSSRNHGSGNHDHDSYRGSYKSEKHDDDNRTSSRQNNERSYSTSPSHDRGRSRKLSTERQSRNEGRGSSNSVASSENEYEAKRKHHKKKDKRSRKDRSRSPRKKSSKKCSRSKRYNSSSDSAYEESSSRYKSKHRRRRHSRSRRSSSSD